MGFDVYCFIVNVFKIYMKSVFLTLFRHVYNLKIITYFIYGYINILRNRYTFLYNWNILLDSKIASSPTNINGAYKYISYFYLRLTFPDPHILLKA